MPWFTALTVWSAKNLQNWQLSTDETDVILPMPTTHPLSPKETSIVYGCLKIYGAVNPIAAISFTVDSSTCKIS